MKKRIIAILAVALSLLCASVCDAYYLLRLKNRGAVTTPAYWFEGNKIHFYVSGGIASLERREIVKIENLEKEVGDYKQRAGAFEVKKEPPGPPAAEKSPRPEKSIELKAGEKSSSDRQGDDSEKKQLQEELQTLEAESATALEKFRQSSEQDSISKEERDEARNRVFEIESKKQKIKKMLQTQ